MRIIVEAPARLHFGILNPFKSVPGRAYVCLGLAVKQPRTIVEVRDGSGNITSIPDVVEVVRRLSELYDIDTSKIDIKVIQHAPRHVGLGSTTQLRLAVACAVLKYFNISVDVPTLAKVLGRGEISGVGTYVFQLGGLVVDTGKKTSDDFPKLLLNLKFPEDWHVVIVIPSGRGPGEIEEHKLFAASCNPELVYRAHFIVLNRLLPAVIECDFDEFTSSLEELQVLIGSMFSIVQGGVYSIYSQNAIEKLKELGLRGVGQSSWGPTVYGFTTSLEHAERAKRELEKLGFQVIVTQADNFGARTYIYRK